MRVPGAGAPTDEERRRPMFPLGSVLVPGASLALHVFEPRYQALVADCTAGDGRFGVVLIERGSEVGGGDVRTSVGTLARIEQIEPLGGGRMALVVTGEHRLRVTGWLADDPYPLAVVQDWPDPEPGPGHDAALVEAVTMLRRALGLLAELGGTGPPATMELDPDPVRAGYGVLAAAPIATLDRHRLLAAPDPISRARGLAVALAAQIELFQAAMREG